MNGTSLWFEITAAFRPETLINWSRPKIELWEVFLTKRGNNVEEGRKRPIVSTIIGVSYRKDHLQSKRMDIIRIEAKESVKENMKPARGNETNTHVKGYRHSNHND